MFASFLIEYLRGGLVLTQVTIRNFKRFDEVQIELGNPVVFIGPNNSGKTTALQALTLWDAGLRRLAEKYRNKDAPKERTGVTINRKDLTAAPVPSAKLLWRDLHTRARKTGEPKGTQNIRIEIDMHGIWNGVPWRCPLEFDYANTESIYCRLMYGSEHGSLQAIQDAANQRIAFLPPMSGLAAEEPKIEPGRINVLLGEGQTAQVLRNQCYALSTAGDDRWVRICEKIKALFGAHLDEPSFDADRGDVRMTYREGKGPQLDLTCSGRGLQQTLLLLAYMYANRGCVLLLDEPDAHLEFLRQQQTYQLLSETASDLGSQVVIASHSEVVLNEAIGKDTVVSFIGKPCVVDKSQPVMQALKTYGFEHYLKAQQTGWVMYLEGSTDLAILREFANRLGHRACTALERPFIYYVCNLPNNARNHFHALRAAKPDLAGVGIFDGIEQELDDRRPLWFLKWRKNEIENYVCQPETLRAYAMASASEEDQGPLFVAPEAVRRGDLMDECIREQVTPAMLRDMHHPLWSSIKASTAFLELVFQDYFQRLGQPNLLSKSSFFALARYVPAELIDPEIAEKLDAIADTAALANPLSS